MKRRNRAASRERRRDRIAQEQADAEVREEWLNSVVGSPDLLAIVAGDTIEGKAYRQRILLDDQVPDGVTHTMLKAAAKRALGRS